jgi:CDK-activating kinase assembly factor MAT1
MSRRGAYTSSSVRGRGGSSSSVNGPNAARPAFTNNANPQRFASTGGAASSSQRDGSVNSALNIGAAPRIQLPSDPSRRIMDYSSADDKCPQCKTDRYLNPKLRLLVSPCYHKLCESCLDRIFSLGPAPCPECGRTCRKNQFGVQTFQDLQVEREVDIRRRVGKLFNKRETDFADLNGYNNYLEEVESITFNLINDIDKEETERRIETYRDSNRASIQNNVRNQEAEAEMQRAREKSDKAFRAERAKRRRERQERDMTEKEADDRVMVEALAGGKGVDVQSVMQKREENEAKREARRVREELEDEQEEKQRQIMMGGSAQGSKKAGTSLADESRPAYHIEMLWDFEGPLAVLDDSRRIFDLQPAPASLGGATGKSFTSYNDPWITTDLPKDEIIRLRAGGYDWSLAWRREIQMAVDGINIAPLME